ncbi:MAG: hypothetical protein NUW37_20310 [Planctomycetes bacterium]|nr:hypothetical protein [Planctomycetota bacterium]
MPHKKPTLYPPRAQQLKIDGFIVRHVEWVRMKKAKMQADRNMMQEFEIFLKTLEFWGFDADVDDWTDFHWQNLEALEKGFDFPQIPPSESNPGQ